MKLRHYLLLRAYLTAALALFTAGLPLFLKVDSFGLYFSIGFSLLCAMYSYSYFKSSRRTREQERAFAPPLDATVAQQIAYYKWIVIVGGAGFLVLTVITAMDLNSLENGRQETVMLLAPVGFLYHTGGYWLAVLSIPLFGILVCGALLWKLRQLNGDSTKVA